MIEIELHEASDLFELDEELFKSKYSSIYSNFNSEEQDAYGLEESISDGDDIFNYSKRKNIASIKINKSETIEITNLDIYHWYQSNYIDSINVWTDQTFVYFSIDIALDQAGSLGIWSIELRDWVFTRRDECFCVKAAIYEKKLDLFLGFYSWHYPMGMSSGEGFFSIDKNRRFNELSTEKIFKYDEKEDNYEVILNKLLTPLDFELRLKIDNNIFFIVDIKQKSIVFLDSKSGKINSVYRFSMLDKVWKGKAVTINELIECGETQLQLKLDNSPKQMESFNALFDLIEYILNPVAKELGDIQLTYGFCSLELSKHIHSRIYPKLDQHSACELNTKGALICDRKGASCDFYIKGMSSLELAKWVSNNTKFDRLYFYGENLPIHVSYGPDHSRQIVTMHKGKSGKLIPKVTQTL
jgi:hypothetical protein